MPLARDKPFQAADWDGVVCAEDYVEGGVTRWKKNGQGPQKPNLNQHFPGGNAMLRGSVRRKPIKHVSQLGLRGAASKTGLAAIWKPDKST